MTVEKLIEAYEEYIKVLTDEIEDMFGLAYAHHFKSRNVERGEQARKKIAELKASSSNTVAPVDNIVESEEKKSWFDENVRFVGWFNKSGLNPFTTSYEEAYKQFKEQTKEVSTNLK